MGLSFNTTKDLRSRIEMLPKGPQWKAVPWPSPGGTPVKEPLTLFYRDALECLESLLQNPLVQDHIGYTPFKLFTTAEKTMRAYTEWLSGNTAWEMQVRGLFRSWPSLTILTTEKDSPQGYYHRSDRYVR